MQTSKKSVRFTAGSAILVLAVVAAIATALPHLSRPSTILILNGLIIDGTGAPRHPADLRISGDKILEIGKLTRSKGETSIDVHGMVVCPGFIDAHSHADGGLLEDPDAGTQIRQGITTAVVGQDGSSNSPLDKYFSTMEKARFALNVASFSGFGSARSAAMGKDFKRHATPEEVAKMRDFVEQDMKAGALGLSSGLEYDPGFYSNTDEIVAASEVAAKYHGLYISHVRDEGNDAIKSFKELIEIARRAHLPAQISHIKLDTQPSWGKAGETLKLIADANRRGQDISADIYPYTYWQSTITVLIPTRNWDDRAAWEKGLAEVGGPSHVHLTRYDPDPNWVNKTIEEIAKQTNKDAISVIQEIVHKTQDGNADSEKESVVVEAMQEKDLQQFVRSPRVMFCTDGGLKPTHPRGAGSYPRVLGRLVREKHVIPLEQAIRKMTSLPARRFGFSNRGLLKPGMVADITVFDARTVIDTATIQRPDAPPAGIDYVFVNGTLVLENRVPTGAKPGRVIRKTGPLTSLMLQR